jgi:hypothetical protein
MSLAVMSLDILKENFINPELADIISNFAPQDRRNNRKAPASPPHHKTRRSRSKRAPGQSEGERGRQENRRKDGGWKALFQNPVILLTPTLGKIGVNRCQSVSGNIK